MRANCELSRRKSIYFRAFRNPLIQPRSVYIGLRGVSGVGRERSETLIGGVPTNLFLGVLLRTPMWLLAPPLQRKTVRVLRFGGAE